MSAADTLAQGLQALGLSLTEAQHQQLLSYLALLQKWNKVYNLTAVRAEEDMLTHHLLDSLSAIAPLRRALGEMGFLRQALVQPGTDGAVVHDDRESSHADGRTPELLDVGSGGGLPGVVIAITCPEVRVTCVDTVAKKAAFIQQAAVQLGLPNLQGVHARVETLPGPYDVICSRAFAALADFTAWSRQALRPGGVWMAMKGKHPLAEMEALPADVQVFHVEPLQVPGLDAERCIVWMRG
jgi:16S rRNA (guanine527-N7)-methyltransferase